MTVPPSNTLGDQGDAVESGALTWHSSGQPSTRLAGRRFPRTQIGLMTSDRRR